MKTTELLLTALLGHFLQFLPVYGNIEDLKWDWEIIAEKYPNDTFSINEIYKKIQQEKRALEEFSTTVERTLIVENAKIIADTISSNNVNKTEIQLKGIYKDILVFVNYDNRISDRIFVEAAHQLISRHNLPSLPDLVWQHYQQNDWQLFDFLSRTELAIYSCVNQTQDKDFNKYLQKLAYVLYKIANDNLYEKMARSTKSSVENIINILPNNSKHLFFKQYFCLFNVNYLKNIYVSKKNRLGYHAIILRKDNKMMGNASYLKAEFYETDSADGKTHGASEEYFV